MKYPIAIEWGNEKQATGIVIPDIPGAITAGDSYDEAYEMAQEVAHLMLTEIVEQGEAVPMPRSVEAHKANPEFEGWGWGLIDIDITPYLGRTEKINVTIPGVVIRKVDAAVKNLSYRSRSAFLTEAALDKLQRSEVSSRGVK
ncbi:type II toxin-antitoxin system HicB family antitoxin [Aliidiomarina halalkaliphila]|uniref:Type II toxin-antitoxin system HicB family antitoxin n=1 Tax=Aliidiomarina halalkaliphila TaxID=2593535 RepID=A0A552X4Q7_9GAMM|nr:type II toxin-antitoxin system HicB family antitoxin [Aliidiomarina halalkaliphila]TRW49995.1 type II toxin-antitoxin system HicB family antitoxin [Aliidiomarina halalkaliphila]